MKNTQSDLSPYAGNILEELKRHVGGVLKTRETDLMRLSDMHAERIIEAREELSKIMDELRERNLITYEKQGDRYIIRNTNEHE